jgi:hypothetical protein
LFVYEGLVLGQDRLAGVQKVYLLHTLAVERLFTTF